MRNNNGIKEKDMRGDLGKESKEYFYRRIAKSLTFKNKSNFMHLQKEKHSKKKVNSSLGDSHHWRMPLVTFTSRIENNVGFYFLLSFKFPFSEV